MGVSYTSNVLRSIVMLDDLGTTTYVGKAAPGSSTAAPVWQIQRLHTVGTVMALQDADGNANFDNVWDDRASLSYL